MKTLIMNCALTLLCLAAAPPSNAVPGKTHCLTVCITPTSGRVILEGAEVTLYEGNEPLQKLMQPNHRNSFRFTLANNGSYTLILRKEGYHSRRISVDTSLPDSVSLALIFEFCARVEMIPLTVKLNPELDDYPIAIVGYDAARDVFDVKSEYTKAVKKGLFPREEVIRGIVVKK